jgi:hypothetical protein
MYPDYEWLEWKFVRTPKSFWENKKNQRECVDWIGKQLKYKEMSDWYNVTNKVKKNNVFSNFQDFENVGCAHLLSTYYNCSPSLLLHTLYPEYNWLPWKFSHIPKNFWTDNKNKKQFLDWAGNQLGIKDYSDWYKVVSADIRDLGGENLLAKHSFSLPQLLAAVYTDFKWERYRFKSVSAGNWSELFKGKEFLKLIKS